MKIGYLFPGQGSQYVSMGKDLYDNYEEAKMIYDLVDDITSLNIKEYSFNGPEDTLKKTSICQLAVLTHSLAILKILEKENITCDMSAGLSLGEYTALINSQAISLEDGIKLVKKRGEVMEKLVPKGSYLMAALLGITDEDAKEICESVNGFVIPVNFNCPGQVVISGYEDSVNKAAELAKEKGARVSILPTAGPFHTSLLKESAKAFASELENVEINIPKNKVVKNLDGTIYTDEDNIKDILENHMINPVQFTKSLNTMLDENIDVFVEIGPGKTLSGFIKRTAKARGKEVKIFNICDKETLENFISFYKGESL